MAEFELPEILMTGRKGIDEQHGELLGMIGNMYACQSNCDVNECSKLLTDYTDKFEKHYQSELGLIMKLENATASEYVERHINHFAKLHAIKPTCKINCEKIECVAGMKISLHSHILRNRIDFAD